MTRPMHPSPATSTTFSCQLSNTLMAAPVDSAEAPGRGPIWLNPVCWGVTRVGVRGALPEDADDVAAMPLYLPGTYLVSFLRHEIEKIKWAGKRKEKGHKKARNEGKETRTNTSSTHPNTHSPRG